MRRWTHFAEDLHEFDSPDAPGSGNNMDPDFVTLLDKMRTNCGFPFVITSGYRTSAHNAEVGGKSASEHMEGKAADINAPTSHMKFAIVRAALLYGIYRIGVGSNFVHLGNSTQLPPYMLWTY